MFQGQLNAMHAFLWMVTRHALLNLNLTSHRLTILFCRVIPRTLMPREVYIYIYMYIVEKNNLCRFTHFGVLVSDVHMLIY